MSGSKSVLTGCLGFIAGIFLESALDIPLWAIATVFIGGVALVLIALAARKIPVITGFFLLCLALGVFRMQAAEFQEIIDPLRLLRQESAVRLEGVVIDEPDGKDVSQQLTVAANGSVLLVTTRRYPEFSYLDRITLEGKLEDPPELEGFNYAGYLKKDGIYSVMPFPTVTLIEPGKPKTLWEKTYGSILAFKSMMRSSIERQFLPPASSIMRGMVLGDNGAMSNELKAQLNVTGLRHVIAISGTHIIILGAMALNVLLFFGLWRSQAIYASIAVVLAYVALVGFPASGVRAGIMGVAYLIGQLAGRPATVSRLLVFSGAAMLLQNPLLLLYDVGFQLSFLAVLGLAYLDPFIMLFFQFAGKKYLRREMTGPAKNLANIVSATVSAQLFTLPVILYNFGNVSLVAPITNILVLPVSTMLMVLGFISALAGMALGNAAWIAGTPALLVTQYFLLVIRGFSGPWAAATFAAVHWTVLPGLYIALAISVRFLKLRYGSRF